MSARINSLKKKVRKKITPHKTTDSLKRKKKKKKEYAYVAHSTQISRTPYKVRE